MSTTVIVCTLENHATPAKKKKTFFKKLSAGEREISNLLHTHPKTGQPIY